MFFGEYEYKVDEKGRIPIPPKFRLEFREGIMVTQGTERCITAYALSQWQEIASALTTRPITRSKLRTLNRAIFGSAFQLSLDRQGRVALPTTLRQYASISDTAIVVGANNCIEVWNKELWSLARASALEQVGQIIESLEI